MNKVLKGFLIVLLSVLAVVCLAVLSFLGVYFSRIQTMGSIEQLTDYADGYNLYRMDVQYNTAWMTSSTMASRMTRR